MQKYYSLYQLKCSIRGNTILFWDLKINIFLCKAKTNITHTHKLLLFYGIAILFHSEEKYEKEKLKIRGMYYSSFLH